MHATLIESQKCTNHFGWLVNNNCRFNKANRNESKIKITLENLIKPKKYMKKYLLIEAKKERVNKQKINKLQLVQMSMKIANKT